MQLIPFCATLNDSTSVLIRPVTQADRHLLEVGFDLLSEQARYFRFLSSRHDLTPAELDSFTAENTSEHVAIGALITDTSPPEPVGIARYIRLRNQPHVAEIAITIVDRHHHQGLGRLFFGVLCKYARQNGILNSTPWCTGKTRRCWACCSGLAANGQRRSTKRSRSQSRWPTTAAITRFHPTPAH